MPSRSALARPAAALTIAALALTGCGAGDPDVTGKGPDVPSALSSSPDPEPTWHEDATPSPDPSLDPSDLPTVPPGDPGAAPSVPEDTSGVEHPHGEPRRVVPAGALLDAETVGAVVGGTWRATAAPADSCDAARPAGAVGTRTGALTGSSGRVVETVATHADGDDERAVSDLAKRLRGCGWTEEAEPPLGEDSAELSRSTPAGPERAIVVTAEGVSVTIVGRGSVVASRDDWAALVDVAIGTSCLAAPDGCH